MRDEQGRPLPETDMADLVTFMETNVWSRAFWVLICRYAVVHQNQMLNYLARNYMRWKVRSMWCVFGENFLQEFLIIWFKLAVSNIWIFGQLIADRRHSEELGEMAVRDIYGQQCPRALYSSINDYLGLPRNSSTGQTLGL